MRIMSCSKIAAAGVMMCLFGSLSLAGLDLPLLHTLTPATTPAGQADARLGIAYAREEWGLFQNTDENRKVYACPDLNVTFGMADNVELLLRYQGLFMEQDDRPFEYGSGDLRITTLFDIVEETEAWPECALMLEVKLPNADDEKGFGTDQTDFLAGGAFCKRFGDLAVLLNASLGILDHPAYDTTQQDDVLVYGIGANYPLTDTLYAGCEVHGIANSRFGNDRSYLRCGIALETGMAVLDLSGGIGLDDASGDFHVAAGITFETQFRSGFPFP